MAEVETVRRPDPDPTTLTTAQLLREMSMVREVIDGRIANVITRLDAMDKAVELLQKYPTEVDRAVSRLQMLHEEKFESVAKEFIASKTAVEAALRAAREAAGKTEGGITKQLDSLVALINTQNAASNDKVEDLRSRLTIVESVKKGAGENLGAIFGFIGALAGISAVVVAISVMVAKL